MRPSVLGGSKHFLPCETVEAGGGRGGYVVGCQSPAIRRSPLAPPSSSRGESRRPGGPSHLRPSALASCDDRRRSATVAPTVAGAVPRSPASGGRNTLASQTPGWRSSTVATNATVRGARSDWYQTRFRRPSTGRSPAAERGDQPLSHNHKRAGQRPEVSYSIRRPEMAREITSCWICSVPSKMSKVWLGRSAGIETSVSKGIQSNGSSPFRVVPASSSTGVVPTSGVEVLPPVLPVNEQSSGARR